MVLLEWRSQTIGLRILLTSRLTMHDIDSNGAEAKEATSSKRRHGRQECQPNRSPTQNTNIDAKTLHEALKL